MAIAILAVGEFGPTPAATTSHAASVAGGTGTGTITAIACPTTTTCYTVGDDSAIMTTRTTGATWQRQANGSPNWLLAPSAIDCPAANVCFVRIGFGCTLNGGALLATADGGATWARRAFPTACPGPGPTCPSVTTCYAFVDRIPQNPNLFRTRDGGRTWQDRGRTPDNTTYGLATAGIGVQSVACPSPIVCYAGGADQLAQSTNGGKRWTRWFVRSAPCPTSDFQCNHFNLMACPGERTCYAGGMYSDGQSFTAVVIDTADGFGTWRRSLIQGLHGLTALACPAPTTCYALGGTYDEPFSPGSFNWSGRERHRVTGSVNARGRVATTTNGGTTWQLARIAQYPFTALACPSVNACYAGGYLGRVMHTVDSGATWRDLIPALFLSGTYGAAQPLHTYSPWFTATRRPQVTLEVVPASLSLRLFGAIPHGCSATTNTEVSISVRNAQGRVVTGPIHVPLTRGPHWSGAYRLGTSTIQATGRLRLDAVSKCSTFSLRVDGVAQGRHWDERR